MAACLPLLEPVNLDADAAGKVTRVLTALKSGDADSVNDLLPLVYEELRQMAAAKLAREKPGQTLQATALVHEAWLRLTGSGEPDWRNRSYFFAAAAEAMRRILVEIARRKCRQKRGGGWERVSLEGAELAQAATDENILWVNEALEELARIEPTEAKVVTMHVFAGMNHAEIGEVLGLSERSVKRYWAYAKAWLYQYIRQGRQEGCDGPPQAKPKQ
jgi:RNA polymerase sigma factor (TIGR02999 family)